MVLPFLIIFFSGFIQGITSFGFSLLALPMLGFLMDLKIIVPMLVIFSLIMNSIILLKLWQYTEIKRIVILIISAIIATPIGATILINLDEGLLKLGVGIIVAFSAIMFKLGFNIKVKNEGVAYIPVGFLSGLLNGSVSLSGPPVILFLTNQKTEKQIFRATLTSFFWILNIATVVVFLQKGLINVEVIKKSSILLPALIIGSILGIQAGNYVKEKTFRLLTEGLLLIMGVLSIVGSLN